MFTARAGQNQDEKGGDTPEADPTTEICPSCANGRSTQGGEEGAAETWASATAIWVEGVRKRIAIASVTVQPTNTNHGQEMCGHHSGMNHPKFQEAATNLPRNNAMKSNAGSETWHSTS